jgi:hypothetical protein
MRILDSWILDNSDSGMFPLSTGLLDEKPANIKPQMIKSPICHNIPRDVIILIS